MTRDISIVTRQIAVGTWHIYLYVEPNYLLFVMLSDHCPYKEKMRSSLSIVNICLNNIWGGMVGTIII